MMIFFLFSLSRVHLKFFSKALFSLSFSFSLLDLSHAPLLSRMKRNPKKKNILQ